MVKIMAVYDEDALYARRLAEYVNRRETIPFTAMAFSNLERLKAFSFFSFPFALALSNAHELKWALPPHRRVTLWA